MTAFARGEGPGSITRDGCAVEVYRRLPYDGELEPLSRYFPPGCTVLELGCGTGRLTRPLLDKGCRVTAVDNSPDMLRHVPEAAARIRCDIETLDLDSRFDVVLLAANLINTADDAMRRGMLVACRRHVAARGCLLFRRHDPARFRSLRTGHYQTAGEVRIHLERMDHGDRISEVSLLYACGDEQWRHHFTVRLLDDEDVRAAMNEAGFASLEWIDTKWGVACIA
jgi:SAM-dependent methyltransferase